MLVYRVKASFVVTGSIGITNCSRGIRNAWHFYYAFAYVFKALCGGFGIALLTPLTGRYVLLSVFTSILFPYGI
ncbi:DUF3265 domain-containing protein [Vibrio parahaemolyticus]|nr:DUF3265 domain-containing protein [Vibrio parahaemolyticus]